MVLKKTSRLTLFSILISTYFLNYCSSKNEFDSVKWRTKDIDWWMGDTREKMVDDIINSDTLKGIDSTKLFKLLGEPDIKENRYKLQSSNIYRWTYTILFL